MKNENNGVTYGDTANLGTHRASCLYQVRDMHVGISVKLKSQGSGRLGLPAGGDKNWKYFIAK